MSVEFHCEKCEQHHFEMLERSVAELCKIVEDSDHEVDSEFLEPSFSSGRFGCIVGYGDWVSRPRFRYDWPHRTKSKAKATCSKEDSR